MSKKYSTSDCAGADPHSNTTPRHTEPTPNLAGSISPEDALVRAVECNNGIGPAIGEHPVATEAFDGCPPNEKVDRALIIGHDGRWLAGWALRFLIFAAAGYIAWQGLRIIWTGILPIILAILLCTVLWPPVRWLRHRNVPGGIASITVLLGFLSIFGGIIWFIAPSVASQSKTLVAQATAGIERLQDWIQGPPLNLKAEEIDTAINEISAKLQQGTSGLFSGGVANKLASGVFAGVSTASSVVVTLVLVFVLSFFFLKDGHAFLPWVRRNVGSRAGWHFLEVLTRIWNTVSGFIRAQAIVSFIDAILIGAGLFLLGVPLAFVLAIITFLGGFIPIVGAISAGAIAVLIALVSEGFTTAIFVLILIVAVQQIEGNILSPLLQSRAMNLHPAIVLLSITVGGGLFGIIGAFLAVPTAATIAVLVRYHSEMVSLRSGEITIDEIKDETAHSGMNTVDKKRTLDALLARFRRTETPDTTADNEPANTDTR